MAVQKNDNFLQDVFDWVASKTEKRSILHELVADLYNRLYGYLLVPFTEAIIFTYDGTNNIQTLYFNPNSVGTTTLNGVVLSPFTDYYFDENKLIIKPANLTIGIKYKVITQYFK